MSSEIKNSRPQHRGHGPGGGMGAGEKPKDIKKAAKSLVLYSRKYIPAVIIALALAVIGTIFSLIGPNKLQDMTDIITEGFMQGIDIDAIADIGYLLVTLYALSFVFTYIQGFIMTTVTQKITKGLRTAISLKINKVPLNYFNKTSFGDVLSRVTNDIDMIGQTLNMSIGTLVTAVTMLIGSLIMMIVTNWIMALTAVAATVIGFGIMMFIMAVSQKHFIRQQTELGRINGHIEEIYTGHNVVKVYNGTKKAVNDFEEINGKLYDSAWKSQFLSGLMMPLMNFIGNFGYVAVCVVGAALVINDKISFGVIVAFMIYIRLFTNPLSQIAQAVTNLQTTAAASERVFEFLNEEEEVQIVENPADITTVTGEVTFDHVHFGYNPEQIIINDFSAKVKPGQKIAIVGPTGAGKTTMVKLLMRFYDVNSGAILLNDHNIKDFNRRELRDAFGMVLQDTWLFKGTIMENIRYGRLDATDEEVIAAAKAARAHHFIQTLPGGYQMELNEDASNVSQGQKQLLTIARAILADNKILILDEATSSVDTRTEIEIQKAMDNLMKGRTSFVIAHRLSTIRDADLILVMKDGDIIEQGNHEELLAANGFYANLYNSQFEDVVA